MNNFILKYILILYIIQCNNGQTNSQLHLNTIKNNFIAKSGSNPKIYDTTLLVSCNDLRILIIDNIKTSDTSLLNYSVENFNVGDKMCWSAIREEVYNIVPDSSLKYLIVRIWALDKTSYDSCSLIYRKKYLIAQYSYNTTTGETGFISDPNGTGRYPEP